MIINPAIVSTGASSLLQNGVYSPHANLIEILCHAFDQLEFLCGPIDLVMAQMADKSGQGYHTLVLALAYAASQSL